MLATTALALVGVALLCVPAAAAVAFPQNPVLDSFNGPDGPLGAGWTTPAASPFGISSLGGRAVGTASGGGAAWSPNTFADVEVYATLPALPSAAHSATLLFRVQNQARNGLPPAGFDYSGYLLEIYNDHVQLDKYDGNSAPVVLQTIAVNPAAGDSYGVTDVGTTITVYRKPAGATTWGAIGTPTTDATYASGYIGFNLGDGTTTLDDFGGGAATAGPPVSLSPPIVSGAAQQGRTLSASQGTWTSGPTQFAYEWQDCDATGAACVAIAGAAAASYVLKASDVGHTIRVKVTATGPTGSGSAVSDATLPVVPAGTSVFPENPVLDGFARPDGPLGSAWTTPAASPFAASIASGRATGTASGGGAVWSATSFADAEVYATLTALPSAGHSASLFWRVQNQARNGLPPAGFNYSGYLLEIYNDHVQLDKYDGNSAPVVLQSIAVTPAAGDSFGVSDIGPTITVYRKPAGGTWAPVGTPTVDGTYAGGYIGLNLGDGTATLDDFGGGAVTAPPANGPVLVIVAHPDDEALAFSGIIESARAAGRRVYVAVTTNGDDLRSGTDSGYCGASSGNPATTAHYGVQRDGETKAGMGVLGLTWTSNPSTSNIFFLGYPDGRVATIAGSATPYTADATGLHRTYADDGDASNLTCNGDLHFLATGTHAPLDAADLAGDFDRVLALAKPTDIYTHGPWEGHPDHVAVYRQVVAAVQRANLRVTLHEAMIHPEGVDNCQELSAAQWPNPAVSNPLARFTPTLDVTAPPLPACSTSPTSFGWGSAGPPTELVPVPADMLATTEAANRKWQVISKYASQNDCTQSGGVYVHPASCGYPRAFVKAHEWFWTEQFPPPTGSAPANLTLPAISGTPLQGQTLTASTGTWSGSPTSYAFQWQSCTSTGGSCVAIADATGQTYLVKSSDVGHALRVVVTATNAAGSTPATSPPTAAVTAPSSAPDALTPPVISGVAEQGMTLTATTGTWSGNPTVFIFQWLNCDKHGGNCHAIGGANSATYVPKADDVGDELRVFVVGLNSFGLDITTSAPTAPVRAASVPPPAVLTAPVVTGTARQGQTLTASTGTWSGTPTSFAYQWQSCNTGGGGCDAIAGARDRTYVLRASDVGHTVRVVVTATNGAGSTSANSGVTAVVTATVAPPEALTPPVVSGTPMQGQTLTSSTGTWSGSPTFAYQWQQCDKHGGSCFAIAGATSRTFVLRASDVGHAIRVIVIGTNSGGSDTGTSAATAVVSAVARPANLTLPEITGIARKSRTLTASTGTWSGSPTSFAYAWQQCDSRGRSCDPIAGATGRTYVLTANDVGDTVRVVVTATNSGGSTSAASDTTDVVRS